MPTPRVSAFEPNPIWQRAREPIFWLDPALKLIWVNRAWEELTGHPASTVLGLTCQAHGPTSAGDPSDLAASFHPPPEAIAGQPSGSPTLIYHAAGERLWRRIEFWPFRDEANQLIGLMGTVRPIETQPSVPDSEGNPLHVELLKHRRRLQQSHGLDNLIGFGPAHHRLLDQIRLAAGSGVPVLIVGEAGTGKRHVARTIHQQGAGRERPLIAFDCQALPPELLEREMFVASDADETGPSARGGRRSRLSLSDGSSLLMNEILSLPRDLQVRLVEALDPRVRLLATTTTEPDAALQSESLRPELYFALTTLVLRLAPLRDRRDELPTLAQHLLERANQRGGPQRAGFSPEAIKVLMAYDWPGNLPELARVIDYALDRSPLASHMIAAEDLPATIRGRLGSAYNPPPMPNPVKPLDELLTEVERHLIETALRQSRSNKSRAAEILGISRPRLYRRIKELNLPDDDPTEEGVGPT